jgi:hypothetical protein
MSPILPQLPAPCKPGISVPSPLLPSYCSNYVYVFLINLRMTQPIIYCPVVLGYLQERLENFCLNDGSKYFTLCGTFYFCCS